MNQENLLYRILIRNGCVFDLCFCDTDETSMLPERRNAEFV